MTDDDKINVVKRNGEIEKLNLDKIHKILETACEGITGVSVSDIEMKAHLSFYDGITTKEINKALIKASADLISEQNPNYQYVSAKILNYELRKDVWGGKEPPKLFTHITKMVSRGFYTSELLEYYSESDWNELDNYIDHDRDFEFSYIGLREYIDKYAIRDRSLEEVTPLETPQITYMLIAALSCLDTKSIKDIRKLYNDFSNWDISLPTPIMAGVRSPTKQFSSCFPAGQKVWTVNGVRNIENVMPMNLVLTDDGSYQMVIANRRKQYNGKFISLASSFSIKNKFTATEDHLIKSIKKYNKQSRKKYSIPEWNNLSDIEIGDFVHIPFNNYILNDNTVFLIDYVSDENYVLCDDGMIRKKSTDKIRTKDFDTKVSPIKNEIILNNDILRFFGYFLAEGHINKNNNSFAFTFSSKEENYINDIVKIAKDNFNIPACVNIKSDNSTSVIFYSKVLQDFILKMVGTGFNTKFINELLMRVDPNIQKHLLIGVIRGDGCVHKLGMTLRMANENLIKQLSQIMLRVGLYPSLFMSVADYTNKYKSNKTYKRSSNNSDIEYITREDTYGISLAPTGNYDFLKEVDKNFHLVKKSQRQTPYLCKYLNGEYYSKVLGISTDSRIEDVYDLQVDNIHSFTVEGISVHNCTVISVDDTLDSIISASGAIVKYVAKKAGIGLDVTRLRAEGSPVGKEKGIKHTGVTPFLRMFEGSLKSCSQGGVRGGSMTTHVLIWHMDIEEFIVLKNNKGTHDSRVRKMDYSVEINDYFYNRFVENKSITLFSPHDVPGLYEAFFKDKKEFAKLYEKYEKDSSIRKKVVSARELFTKIIIERKETGRLYIFNVDNANDTSPFDAAITTSNLCLSGDTRVKCLIGSAVSELTLSEINDLIWNGVSISVLSKDIEKEEVSYQLVTNSALTKNSTLLMEIFDEDSQKSIKCTPDHKIYTKNRGYVEAKNLKEDDILDFH